MPFFLVRTSLKRLSSRFFLCSAFLHRRTGSYDHRLISKMSINQPMAVTAPTLPIAPSASSTHAPPVVAQNGGESSDEEMPLSQKPVVQANGNGAKRGGGSSSSSDDERPLVRCCLTWITSTGQLVDDSENADATVTSVEEAEGLSWTQSSNCGE